MNIFDLYTADLGGVKLIEASAGTGKTFTLSGLYIRYIVEKKLTPDKILVLTFTKAATAELKTRLRQQLIQCRNHLQDREIVDKAKQPQLYNLYESYRKQQTAIKYIELALICFDQAAIFTINGFCQKIIDDFNSDCGSPVFKELIVKKEQVKKYVYKFWRKQQKNTPQEFLAIIPPIDKVINKINGLLNKSHYRQVKPAINWHDTQKIYDIYCELAIQWQEQQQELLDYILSGDFHGGSYKIAARDNYAQDMVNFFSNFNGKVVRFCASYIESKLLKNSTLKPMPKFFGAFEQFYNQVIYTYPTQSTGNNLAISYMYECYKYVQQQLTTLRVEQGKFDYSDQIKVVHTSISSNPRLVNNIASQWQCIMVDEFQDTDNMQLDIFDKCFNDGKHDLIYVGDPKQAIYDFRGADVFVYNHAKKQTKQQFNLSTNWRSSDKMLAASNAMFNFPQSFKFPWLEFTASTPKVDQHMQLQDIYPPVAILDCEQESRKSMLATEIKRFLAAAQINQKAIQPENCAILVNYNKDALELYEYLLSQAIAVSLWSESGVFATQVAKQLYYLIRAINHPTQSNIFTTLHGMFFAVNLNKLPQLDMEKALSEFIDYRIASNSTNIVKVIEQIFDTKQVQARLLQRIDGERHFADLLHIIELLQEQIDLGNNHNQLQQWLATQIQQVETMENDELRKRRIESDSKKISIMTIHKSKGLEFEHIFIPYADKIKDSGSNENINLRASLATHDENDRGVLYWQHSKTAQKSHRFEKQAENIRNLYVAITRAKHRVYIGVDTTASSYKKLPITQLLNNIIDETKLCATVNPTKVYAKNQNITTTKLAKPNTFNRNLSKPQSIYSFSALMRKQSISHETTTEDVVADTLLDYNNYFQFPKGSTSGTMQHEILENLAFDSNITQISTEVIKQLKKYDFEHKWHDCLIQQINKILNTQLWANGCSLAQVQHSIDEMEFMLPIDSITNKQISSWLTQHRKTHTVFKQDKLAGYLTGFIDLVFEFNNKYYVVDYKSNYLGSTYKDYSTKNLKQAMQQHYYDLQYLLYCVALVKFLQITVNGFNYQQHFGGIAYLFTRGISGKPGQGIYTNKPDIKLINHMIGAFNVR
ncbi:Exodeoxyribonuclease V beta chain [hydrothermal vent metagenome]|uniref:DNA 3'-5' helicase n=1 Tax=hydrothermal vent metagenome TaxID=652676 RepID=A0A3B0VU29_9ZZZZ